MERAAWIPGWYALDQPLKVGLTSDFWFFKDPRTEVLHRGPERLVFYNALWGSHAALGGSGTITRITSPELGEIREVDTESEPFVGPDALRGKMDPLRLRQQRIRCAACWLLDCSHEAEAFVC